MEVKRLKAWRPMACLTGKAKDDTMDVLCQDEMREIQW